MEKMSKWLYGGVSLSAVLFAANSALAQNCTNAAATPSVCAYDAAKNTAAKTKVKGVLLMDWRNGGHDRGPTQRSMMRLAQKYGFKLDRSESQTYITAATLQGIDVIVFNNGDQDPIPGSTQLQAVRDFVEKQGKGVVVIHAGAAYIPCPNEDLANANCRWVMRGLRTQFWIHNPDNTKATIFADSVMTGQIPPRATGTSAVASARNHGRKNPETRNIFEGLPTNAGNGANANRPYVWEGLGCEWYNYQNNPRLEGARTFDGVSFGPINVLLSLDESSVAASAGCNGGTNQCKNQGTFGDRPVSWTRKVGNGLFAYQNAGHSDVYVRARTAGTATVNDSIIEKYNWRLLKYLAKDFIGCMDPTNPAYNPEATVEFLTPGDDQRPCGTVLAAQKGYQKLTEGASITPSLSKIEIDLQGDSKFEVIVADASGKSKHFETTQSAKKITVANLRSGTYFVKWKSAKAGKVESVYVP
jgi:Trehalose utilisation